MAIEPEEKKSRFEFSSNAVCGLSLENGQRPWASLRAFFKNDF